MRIIFFLFILLSSPFSRAEIGVKIHYEQTENGYKIYADNKEFCPVSIQVDFTLSNLKKETANSNIYILEPSTKKILLTTLSVVNKTKSYKFSYTYIANRGEHSKADYEEDYIYFLPYKKDNSFFVHQGYDGTFSHQKENSLDFTMPIGTEITAIRDGIVVEVVENNNRNCGKETCKKFNNYIRIYHSDGTFADYVHIKHNGSKVNPGDKVIKGEVIGFSGNVGWSTGPHLHLVVYLQNLKERKTIKTKFLVGESEDSVFLKEGKEYRRDY